MNRGLVAGCVAVVAVVSLGCAGLVGYGAEQARVPVTSGVGWGTSYTARSDAPHQLWLDYDLRSTGGRYSVNGPIDTSVGGAPGQSWAMNFTDTGSPVSGGRVSYNGKSTSMVGNYSASGSIWLVELPAVPAGTVVDVSGLWTLAPNTTATQLDVVVTD